MSHPSKERLIHLLLDARARQLSCFEALDSEQLLGHQEHHLEPPIWEMGHVAWFQELYLLRRLDNSEPLFARGDQIYDSFQVSYKKRWSHDFPSRNATLDYARRVLDACIARLDKGACSEEEAYLYELVAAHEYMHTENLIGTCKALGFASHRRASLPAVDEEFARVDVAVPGGHFPLGAHPEGGFALDNEMWAHIVEIQPFAIANTQVSNADWVAFLEADPYANRSLWTKDGWNWRRRAQIEGPLYWRRRDGQWQERDGQGWEPIEPNAAVCHVNLHEARAFCRFAERRLPTEAEWEMAASWDPKTQTKTRYPWGDEAPSPERVHMDFRSGGTTDVRAKPAGDSHFGLRQMMGNTWEWTSSKLTAYPGFSLGPYEDYSQPYFGKKPVLRGGAWCTSTNLSRNTWRNFFIKHRRNIFSGIRTCALNS